MEQNPLIERIEKFLAERQNIASLQTKEDVQNELWKIREALQECELLLLGLQRQVSKLRRAKTNKMAVINSKKTKLFGTDELRFIKGMEIKRAKINELLKDEIAELDEIKAQMEDLLEFKSMLTARRSECKLCLTDTKFVATMKALTRGVVIQPVVSGAAEDKPDGVDITTFLEEK